MAKKNYNLIEEITDFSKERTHWKLYTELCTAKGLVPESLYRPYCAGRDPEPFAEAAGREEARRTSEVVETQRSSGWRPEAAVYVSMDDCEKRQ